MLRLAYLLVVLTGRDSLFGLERGSLDVGKLLGVPGTVAVSTERLKARLRYLYIAYQPLSPL